VHQVEQPVHLGCDVRRGAEPAHGAAEDGAHRLARVQRAVRVLEHDLRPAAEPGVGPLAHHLAAEADAAAARWQQPQ
jgi:signal transduction histidine kinase